MERLGDPSADVEAGDVPVGEASGRVVPDGVGIDVEQVDATRAEPDRAARGGPVGIERLGVDLHDREPFGEVGQEVARGAEVDAEVGGRLVAEAQGPRPEVVVAEREGVPVRLDHIARVTTGPAERRGVLDKAGAEAVGGVVVVRYGENPLQVIERVHAKIAEISPGLPKRTLEDGRISQVKVVPFYDRTTLIHETLDTLRTALTDEVLITIVVVVVMLFELRTSLLISALLPVAVLTIRPSHV